MTANLLRRPILVAGLGLTAGAWLWHGIDPTIVHFGSTAVWGAIVVGSGVWWLKLKSKPSSPVQLPVQPVDRAMVEKSFSTVESRIAQLAQELATSQSSPEADVTTDAGSATEPAVVQQLRQQLTVLKAQLDRQNLQVAILGSPSVGKTTLARLLQLEKTLSSSAEAALLTETTLCHETEAESQQAANSDQTAKLDVNPAIHSSGNSLTVNNQVTNADLVVFVVTGDLTDSEFQTIQQLTQRHHRVLLAFNKQDQYLPDDRPVILQQLRERLQALVPAEDLIAVTAQPATVKVRQYQADGTVQERIEQPEPEVGALQKRLQQVLTTQTQSLILATTFRQTQALIGTVQQALNQVRRTRALPVIEQYQWIAAAAAFANPMPSLDLLATASINAQMVMDLGALYQQPFSLEQAKTVTGNLAAQMVKLGLVEMASQAIAPLLKSHALTYVAGGTLQGISAAYLTRLAGMSLVEYFEEQSQATETASSFQIDRLIQKLKAVFQENQRSAFLQNLVKQGIGRLVPQAAPAN